ncbi:hypothetical protein G7Z17_g5019 [Cylindrodendrum hubeiense]|uniref:Uncharacterized protein n=1 Tax=Cylindrodendrum hubeiense TaxID=595255 RepID=A0A9P5HBP3_9HYPO|nr:hypothetical protein G7Z17_g5019 [Cylindrodendrum hubeiense]
MAAPMDKTIDNLTGRWILNKKLSDSSDPVLALQGIGFLTRKAINMASITLDFNQYTAPPTPPNTSTDVFTYIDITQNLSGKGDQESRCLDNTFREHSSGLFGIVKGKTTWVSLDEIDDEFLKRGWLVEGEGKLIKTHVESKDNGWVATQVWGFKMVDGERRYCRNLAITKGDKRVLVQFVYDFIH